MGYVVMKFGGSSISSLERMQKVASHIKDVFGGGEKVVVVLSARGDTTDELIKLAEDYYGGVIPNSLRGELDKLLVTGEEQSVPLLVLALASIGVPAISMTSREIHLEASVNGRVKNIKEHSLIEYELNKNKVVIITGFQGVRGLESMETITTLGRGGSDVTAVCLAAILGGCRCRNYTDVDGIYTTDPRVVPNAKRFDEISYQQLIQMASVGGGKLMDRAVILAQNLGVEIRVLLSPSFGKSTGGTLVRSGSTLLNIETEESLASLAIQKLNMIRISNIPNQPGMAAKIFAALQDINLRDSVQAPSKEKKACISIFFADNVCSNVLASLELIKNEVIPEIKISALETIAVLTLVDPLMNDRPGYLHDICEALGEAKVNIISQTSAGINIEVIVGLNNLDAAAHALAKKFKLVVED